MPVKLLEDESCKTSLMEKSTSVGSGNGLMPSGNKPLPEPMLTLSFMMPYGVIRPQWINSHFSRCWWHHRPYIRWVNSLWPSDAIWQHRSRSTLAEVMVCCLTAAVHYLNQYWRIISEVLWHSPESNFTGNAQDIYPWYSSLLRLGHCLCPIWWDWCISLKIINLWSQSHLSAANELIMCHSRSPCSMSIIAHYCIE